MIRSKGLTRHFRTRKQDVEAVCGLDLEVEPGEQVALLGPNGAGKSTSLRMLTTLLPPSSGTAEVAGYDIATEPHEVRLRIGYLGQGNSAGYLHLVRDELYNQGRVYGMSRAWARERAAELMHTFDFEDLANRRVMTLSGGQKRRLDIAMALMHRPQLLFLDEPSTGLDPQSRAALWELIDGLRRDFGTTILFCTHYLDEADQWADRVLVVDRGRVIADDTPQRLKAQQAGDRIVVTTGDTFDARRAAQVVATLSGVQETSVDGTQTTLRVDHGDALLPELVLALDVFGVKVLAADLRRPTLDDVFLSLTGRRMREDRTDETPTTSGGRS